MLEDSTGNVKRPAQRAGRQRGSEDLGFLFLALRRDLEEGCRLVDDGALCDFDLFDILAGREVESHIGPQFLKDGAETAGPRAALDRLAGERSKRRVLEGQLDFLAREELCVLLGERVLG